MCSSSPSPWGQAENEVGRRQFGEEGHGVHLLPTELPLDLDLALLRLASGLVLRRSGLPCLVGLVWMETRLAPVWGRESRSRPRDREDLLGSTISFADRSLQLPPPPGKVLACLNRDPPFPLLLKTKPTRHAVESRGKAASFLYSGGHIIEQLPPDRARGYLYATIIPQTRDRSRKSD